MVPKVFQPLKFDCIFLGKKILSLKILPLFRKEVDMKLTGALPLKWLCNHYGWISYKRAIILYFNKGCFMYTYHRYSRLSLSRLRLSRTTAYLEEKIWSLLKHRNLKSGIKILWMRLEIAPREQFLPFPQYFQYIFLIKGVYLHIHLLNLVVRFVFSSILKIWYVELRISRSVSEGPFKFEITRVDCIWFVGYKSLYQTLHFLVCWGLGCMVCLLSGIFCCFCFVSSVAFLYFILYIFSWCTEGVWQVVE